MTFLAYSEYPSCEESHQESWTQFRKLETTQHPRKKEHRSPSLTAGKTFSEKCQSQALSCLPKVVERGRGSGRPRWPRRPRWEGARRPRRGPRGSWPYRQPANARLPARALPPPPPTATSTIRTTPPPPEEEQAGLRRRPRPCLQPVDARGARGSDHRDRALHHPGPAAPGLAQPRRPVPQGEDDAQLGGHQGGGGPAVRAQVPHHRQS